MKIEKWLYIIGIMSMAVLTGCQGSATEETPAVAEAVVETNMVEAWGEVEAKVIKEINISFPATVEKLYVQEGDEVKKGDKLASLDYEDYKQSIVLKEKEGVLDEAALDSLLKDGNGQSAEAAALQSEINLIQNQINNGTDPEILEIEANIKDIDEKIKELEKDYAAKKELLEAGGVAQKELDDIKVQIDAYKREKETLKIKIDKLNQDKKLKLETLNASITAKQAEMNSINRSNASNVNSTQVKKEIATLDAYNMKQRYNKTYIEGNDVVLDLNKGIIESIAVVEGSVLGEDNTTLMRIIDEDSIVVTANVPEEFIKDVKIGAKVNIIPYADKNACIEGTVTSIAKKAVEVNGETVIKVEVRADEASPYLCDGYSVDVEIMAQ